MLVIGLIGGVASGKSLVAKLFVELGAEWLDADQAGHEALGLQEVKDAIHERFGDEVFGPDGQIARPALGRLVFGNTSQAVAIGSFSKA